MESGKKEVREIPWPIRGKDWKYIFDTYPKSACVPRLDPATTLLFKRRDVDVLFVAHDRIVLPDEMFERMGGSLWFWVVAGRLADGRLFFMESGFKDTPKGADAAGRGAGVVRPWAWGSCGIAINPILFITFCVPKVARELVRKGMEVPKWER